MPKKEEDKGPFQAGFTPSASTTTSFFDRKKNKEECKLDVVDLFVCVDVSRLSVREVRDASGLILSNNGKIISFREFPSEINGFESSPHSNKRISCIINSLSEMCMSG